MKKILIPLIIFCLTIGICIPVQASTIIESNELKQNEELILESANRILLGQIDHPLQSEDIDYSKAIKVYINMNILEDEVLDADAMKAYTDNSDYIYYLPIQQGNDSICLTISKGRRVSEQAEKTLEKDSIERLRSLTEKWYVPAVEIFSNEIDYNKELQATIKYNKINNAKIYYVGGISNEIPLVAVLFPEDSSVKFKIIDGYEAIDSSMTQAEDLGVHQDENRLYSYEEIKEIALSNVLNTEETGSLGQSYFNNERVILTVLSVLIILSVVSFAVFYIVNKKEKNYDQ